LSQAVARRPDQPRYGTKLAEAYLAANRAAEAASLLELLGRKFPDDDQVYVARARLATAGGRYEVALKLLDPRHDRVSADALLLGIRGVGEVRGEAEPDGALKPAVQKSPDDANARVEYVEPALRQKQSAAALKRVDEARPRFRNDPRLDLLAAEAYFNLG